MSYEPPDDEGLRFAYEDGQRAAREGYGVADNPYKPGNHERDTTWADELHRAWESGHDDYDLGDEHHWSNVDED